MKTILLLTTLMLAACVKDDMDPTTPKIGMPNPASAYCVQQGGTLEIRTTDKGQIGYCHLPDGRVVEEWALFRASRP